MPKSSEYILNHHPCFGAKRHQFGRMHLAVATKCNISCNYCDRRYDCVNQSAPGVTAAVLKPNQVKAYVKKRDTKENNLMVLGIAGPGEPLYNEETFETLKIIQQYFPDKILCLSTNGLLLPQSFERLQALGVDTVTITINTRNLKTAKKIYGERESAYIESLLENQSIGARMVAQSQMLLKINMVYMPGINEDEVRDMALFCQNIGADFMNIMPLIPQKHLAHLPAPTPEEIENAQVLAGCFVEQLTGCSQCRADACGIPGCGRRLAVR